MGMSVETYHEEIVRWRASMDETLREENSWLALTGLIWLELDSTPFGADETLAIALQVPNLAPIAGEFVRDEKGIELIVHPGSRVLVDGEPQDRVRLRPDKSGNPQVVTVGSFTMMLIERGERLGIRLWDNERPLRRSFGGRLWFPVDPVYRLTAKFIPYNPNKTIVIASELGVGVPEPSPGSLEFELEGKLFRLDALERSSDGLFLLIKDESSNDETYGSGRFLVTPAPENGQVTLDFNRAYNPPCAFTPFATCPLPPAQNHLTVAIRAGEKRPILPGD
ncbi:MAG: DUF1684 domain-containing protein [Anaerolineales bacterium]|nr:MAG: DUF1684 domain-containing protein [Anaerolineales bacterium]